MKELPTYPICTPDSWGYMETMQLTMELNLSVLLSAIVLLERRWPLYCISQREDAPAVIDAVIAMLGAEQKAPATLKDIRNLAIKATQATHLDMQCFAEWILCRILSRIDEGELDRNVLQEEGTWLECKSAWLGFVFASNVDITLDYDRAIIRAQVNRPKGISLYQVAKDVEAWANLLSELRVASEFLRVHAIDYAPPVAKDPFDVELVR